MPCLIILSRRKTYRVQEDVMNNTDVAESAFTPEREDEPGPSSDEFSERDETPVRKSKRPRTTRAKSKAPRKKYVRGKQGRLEGIMKMPMEIFAEIVSHITPGDLVSLLRTNKFFRRILLQRSSLPIWQCAQRNVSNLPPCPTGMSEPQYAVLLFSKTCTLCGSSATAQPDPHLRARLCASCRDTKLEQVPLGGSQSRIDYQCVARSFITKPKIKSQSGRNYGPTCFCFREDVDDFVRQRAAFFRSGDLKGLKDWQEDLKRAVEVQIKEGDGLRAFINLMAMSRSSELDEVKAERRDIIHKRLTELGWEEKYFNFYGEDAKPWKALVEAPKPLTERVWTNILPKLVPLLESNRVRIQQAEARQRRSDRRKKLNDLLCKVKQATHPYQAIIDALGVEIPANIDRSSDDGLAFPNPFPESVVALKWDFLQDMYEEDFSLERVEELFNAQRAQLDQKVLEWRADVESQFVKQYGADLDGKDDSDVILTVRGSTEATRHLSRNARFLLRADTIFTRTKESLLTWNGEQSRLTKHFPVMASASDEVWFDLFWDRSQVERIIHPERHIRNTEMETIAKGLLRNMAMPDVAHIELVSMNQVFVCGRCGDTKPKSWNSMLLHYYEALQRWTLEEKLRPVPSTRHPILFRNEHDLESTTNSKPLVRILLAEEAVTMVSTGASNFDVEAWPCMLCGMGLNTYWVLPDQIRAHLEDAHGVVDPVEGIHYKTSDDGDSILSFAATEWRTRWDEFHDALLSQNGTKEESAAGPSGAAIATSSSGAA